MRHQLQQGGVIIARNIHFSVVIQYESYRLAHLICGESRFDGAQVQFYYQAPRHSIAMQYWGVLQGERFERMSSGMTQVQRLAYALLGRVFSHNMLFYSYRLGHHALQLCQIGLLNVER